MLDAKEYTKSIHDVLKEYVKQTAKKVMKEDVSIPDMNFLDKKVTDFYKGLNCSPKEMQSHIVKISKKLNLPTGGLEAFKKFIEIMTDIKEGKISLYSTDDQLAILMAVAYFMKIQKDFHSTMAGHLFENWVAGLMGEGYKVLEDEGSSQKLHDIENVGNNEFFTLKFNGGVLKTSSSKYLEDWDINTSLILIMAEKTKENSIIFHITDIKDRIMKAKEFVEDYNKFVSENIDLLTFIKKYKDNLNAKDEEKELVTMKIINKYKSDKKMLDKLIEEFKQKYLKNPYKLWEKSLNKSSQDIEAVDFFNSSNVDKIFQYNKNAILNELNLADIIKIICQNFSNDIFNIITSANSFMDKTMDYFTLNDKNKTEDNKVQEVFNSFDKLDSDVKVLKK